MSIHSILLAGASLAICAFSNAAKHRRWVDSLLHADVRIWVTGAPMPQDKTSRQHWSRHDVENGASLEYEILPLSTTVTGNVAVVQ